MRVTASTPAILRSSRTSNVRPSPKKISPQLRDRALLGEVALSSGMASRIGLGSAQADTARSRVPLASTIAA